MNRSWTFLSVFASVGINTGAYAAAAPAAPSSTVPFTMRQSGGNPRVVVMARFNGHPMPMMVHSNATFFSQLRHGEAAAFGVRLNAGSHRSYGIDRGGHVSDLGRDEGSITTLAVGRSVNRDAEVSVFEVPQGVMGMLGTGWITANRVIVDYAHKKVIVSPTVGQVEAMATALRRSGYVGLPIAYDEGRRLYTVGVTVNGVTRPMTVSTASAFNLDTAFADAASLRYGADRGGGHGPTGTDVPEYRLIAPVGVRIGGWTSPAIADGNIMDQYGYSAQKRPVDPATADGGTLGGAFLTRTGAVVDFGTRTIYVKRSR